MHTFLFAFEKLGAITGVYHDKGRHIGPSVNFNEFSVPGMSTNSPAMGTNDPADNTISTEGAVTSIPDMTTPLVVGVSFINQYAVGCIATQIYWCTHA